MNGYLHRERLQTSLCPQRPSLTFLVSKNRIWFDDSLNAVVGYYDPSTGVIKTLTSSNHPHDGLAVDSNDNIWFTEEFGGLTGRLVELPADTL